MNDGRLPPPLRGRAVERSRRDTRDAVVRYAHAASVLARVCDANDGRASSSEVAPQRGGDVASRGSNRRIPRAGDEATCGAASLPRRAQEKIPFREKCMYSQSLLFVGTILRAWEYRNGRENSLRAGDGGRGGRGESDASECFLDRLPAAKAVFPWWTGHSRPRRALGPPIKCASPDALRDAPERRERHGEISRARGRDALESAFVPLGTPCVPPC